MCMVGRFCYSCEWADAVSTRAPRLSHDRGIVVCPCKVHDRAPHDAASWDLSTEPGSRGNIRFGQKTNRFPASEPTAQGPVGTEEVRCR